MKLIASLLLLSASAFAQAVPTVTEPVYDYKLGVGYGVSPSSSLGGFKSNQEAFVQGSVKVPTVSKLWVTTTIDFTPTSNVMRGGAAYQVAPHLLFRVDGGLALGAVAIGSFAGGLVYEQPLKSGLAFVTELRVTTNPAGPSGSVNVGLYFSVSHGVSKGN